MLDPSVNPGSAKPIERQAAVPAIRLAAARQPRRHPACEEQHERHVRLLWASAVGPKDKVQLVKEGDPESPEQPCIHVQLHGGGRGHEDQQGALKMYR